MERLKPIADGTLHGASRADLAAHDPSQLARTREALVRRLRTRFFLSCGATHDRVTASFARAFARELAAVRIRHRLLLLPGGHNGKFWRAQLPAALEYAFSPTA